MPDFGVSPSASKRQTKKKKTSDELSSTDAQQSCRAKSIAEPPEKERTGLQATTTIINTHSGLVKEIYSCQHTAAVESSQLSLQFREMPEGSWRTEKSLSEVELNKTEDQQIRDNSSFIYTS